MAPDYTLEFISCFLPFCSSHSGVLLLWTHQVHTPLWAFTVLFPLRISFLFSHLTIADSSFMTQHKYYFPSKTEHCYPTWNSTHLKHFYHISDFLHCIGCYLLFSCLHLLIYFSSPTTYDITFRRAENRFILLTAAFQVPRTMPGKVFLNSSECYH